MRFVWGGVCVALLITGPMVRSESSPRWPILANEEAWKRLPDAPAAAVPLPTWARMLVGWQPITTARMLELDALHRSGDRLDARLRAIVRWAAADANRCEYAKQMAAADYARHLGTNADLAKVMSAPNLLCETDRLAALFARRMMIRAVNVTDEEVKRLIELLGDERMVALVALVAHASFQDRIFLTLNLVKEPGEVPAPVMVRFGRPKPMPSGKAPEPAPMPMIVNDRDIIDTWQRGRKQLALQKERTGRIRVPSIEEVSARLGPNHPASWQTGILWSRVCYAHQPELTDAWFDCSGAYRQEGRLDPLFTNAIFWVVTDSLDCFY